MADVIVISHFGLFFALLPPNSPKKQNFEKTKKAPGDIIILHMCTKNYDQMTYNSWDMVHDRCNYVRSWAIFCSFIPLTAWKPKFWKKWKKYLGIWPFYKYICTKNFNQMMYSSWDMVHDRYNYFSFWDIFCTFTPLTAWKIKTLKKWKQHQKISSIYICAPKIMIG